MHSEPFNSQIKLPYLVYTMIICFNQFGSMQLSQRIGYILEHREGECLTRILTARNKNRCIVQDICILDLSTDVSFYCSNFVKAALVVRHSPPYFYCVFSAILEPIVLQLQHHEPQKQFIVGTTEKWAWPQPKTSLLNNTGVVLVR